MRLGDGGGERKGGSWVGETQLRTIYRPGSKGKEQKRGIGRRGGREKVFLGEGGLVKCKLQERKFTNGEFYVGILWFPNTEDFAREEFLSLQGTHLKRLFGVNFGLE